MLNNVGPGDRVVRIAAALIIGFFLFMGFVDGVAALLLGLLAAVLLVTALVGFCPLYRMIGIDSHVHE